MTAQDRYVTQPEVASEHELPPADPEEMWSVTVLAVLTRLTRHKWLIAKTAGIAFVIGVVVSLLLPASYTAITRIMTPQQTPSAAGLLMNQMGSAGGGQLAMAAAGGLGLRNPNDVYIGLLGSRPVADAIIQQFGLRGLYRAKDMTAARRKLAANTNVASEKSTFITVSVTDHDRQRAAAIANVYTEQLRILTKTLALTEASHRRIFYEEQLKHAKEDVIGAELAFRQIEQKKGLVQLDAQAKAMIGLLAALHAQVSAKQVELQALRSYSTEQNPDVQLTERELSSLQQEVSGLEQRQQHGPSSGSAELGLQDVAGAGLDYLRAEHELQYRQILFDLLLKQYDIARLDEAKDAAVVQVVEAAIAPDRRSSPGRAFITLIFTLLGVAGACGYLFLADFSQKNPRLDRWQSLAPYFSADKYCECAAKERVGISVAASQNPVEHLVVLGSDHNGVALKGAVKPLLQSLGKSVIDLGPFSDARKVDYGDYANAVGQIIENGEAHWGVLICGTGVGMSMVANRFQQVRAALVHSLAVAHKSREHNDANVLCLGAWVNSDADNLAIVDAWFGSPFGHGRHCPRLEKISPHKPANIVLTNGIFDIVHTGHIALLQFAKSFGGRLIVAINSDASTRRLKGEGRPVNHELDRKAVLESLDCVDEVIIFDDPNPQQLMETVRPDIVVKGAEWSAAEVRRRDSIPDHIDIKVFPLVFESPGKKYSTSSIIERVHSL